MNQFFQGRAVDADQFVKAIDYLRHCES
jgi:hypothetical protein